MMIAQKGYQALNANGEPYIRHGRDGLPTVWEGIVCGGRGMPSVGVGRLPRPRGRELAWVWNAVAVQPCPNECCCSCMYVFARDTHNSYTYRRRCISSFGEAGVSMPRRIRWVCVCSFSCNTKTVQVREGCLHRQYNTGVLCRGGKT